MTIPSAAPFFTSNETSSWLLYILTDSALPTGGFVASSGLEASWQAGLIDNENLAAWVTTSAHNYASNTNCFVRAGYEAPDREDPLAYLIESDNICDAVMAANTVARRASLAQGIAMLTLYLKCFTDSPEHITEKEHKQNMEVVKKWKSMIRGEKIDGHFAICYGLICRYLKVDLDNTLHLWLYLFTRTIYSSAVRLNVVGPYEAQKLLLQSRKPIEVIIKETKDIGVEDCCQTNPLLDVCQGMHDRLYSRLFNS
ncbi:urease accessory protein UreF [Mucor ambiguus]|uniref:Urease accessory protein UreF n=1 Tax=Mucor ambiguus TaxID=91626 RepID=A0A0C9N1Y0_9FUNG|nr:urease accessory protein UreF [Mucor ambiguus]